MVNLKNQPKKHLMACTASKDATAEPSYIWIRGKLQKNNVAVDSVGPEYESKVMEMGWI